jgi:hypothetical protein
MLHLINDHQARFPPLEPLYQSGEGTEYIPPLLRRGPPSLFFLVFSLIPPYLSRRTRMLCSCVWNVCAPQSLPETGSDSARTILSRRAPLVDRTDSATFLFWSGFGGRYGDWELGCFPLGTANVLSCWVEDSFVCYFCVSTVVIFDVMSMSVPIFDSICLNRVSL